MLEIHVLRPQNQHVSTILTSHLKRNVLLVKRSHLLTRMLFQNQDPATELWKNPAVMSPEAPGHLVNPTHRPVESEYTLKERETETRAYTGSSPGSSTPAQLALRALAGTKPWRGTQKNVRELFQSTGALESVGARERRSGRHGEPHLPGSKNSNAVGFCLHSLSQLSVRTGYYCSWASLWCFHRAQHSIFHVRRPQENLLIALCVNLMVAFN